MKMDSREFKKSLIPIIFLSFLSFFIISSSNIAVEDKSGLEYVSLRIVRQGRLDFLLTALTPEVISKIESQSKFVIHSGHSGVGQGTIKEKMLELYPEIFQRFLLYATRSRRGIEFQPSDPRYLAVKKYFEMASGENTPSSMEALMSELSEDEQKTIKSLEERKQVELRKALFPDWNKILASVPRQDIPGLDERFRKNDGSIMAYTEFSGVHYWFVTQDEIFRLRDEEGIIVEPVREHYQGLDVKAIAQIFEIGNNKIVILEGDRVWFDHVHSRFPKSTSIFISPISEREFKERMIAQLGEEKRDNIMELNITGLLEGGIEKYITKEQS